MISIAIDLYRCYSVNVIITLHTKVTLNDEVMRRDVLLGSRISQRPKEAISRSIKVGLGIE